MWLTAKRDLRSEHIDPALPDTCLDRGRTSLEIVLPPRPTAAQRGWRVEPGDRACTLERRIGLETEDRIVVEEHVGLRWHACGRWILRVDRDAKDRAGDVV